MSRQKKPSILVIASSYAPSAEVGAKRFSFLAPIFEEDEYKICVLTRKEKYYSSNDDTLPIVKNIYRAGIFPPYYVKPKYLLGKIYMRIWKKYLCLIDPFSGWIFPALLKGLQIVKKEKIDLIIATCPMFSTIVAAYLISLISKTKLILDYRDPWSLRDYKHSVIVGKKLGRFFEKLAIKQAKAIVFVTRRMKKDFIENFGNHTNAICRVIPNGFHNNGLVVSLSLGENKKNMIYAGKLYGERSINLLAKPIKKLLNDRLINKDTFCFHIFGKLNDEDRATIENNGLSNLILEHATVPFKQIIRYLNGADILVLIIGLSMSYSISYKFFDYLSVNRPILAVVPENSAMVDLMNEIDCGRWADINSDESILDNLRQMLLENKRYNFSGAEKYTWEALAKKYGNLIDHVSKQDLY
jgi:glycosyltransferase involved in cell wall biosynthesis